MILRSGDAKPISRDDYDQLCPKDQGYVSYMQGAWNGEIPEKNIYQPGTEQYKQFSDGQQLALIECIDVEE